MDHGCTRRKMEHDLPIRLSGRDLYRQPSSMNFRPVTVTKQGNLFFHDNENRLFKYYPKINPLRCISQDTWVISPFVENLVPFEHHNSVPITSGYQYEIQYLDEHERINEQSSWISKVLRWIKLQTPTILLTTSVVSLVIFAIIVFYLGLDFSIYYIRTRT